MSFDWKQALIRTAMVVVVIYALEYGASRLAGHSFQRPATGSLIAAIVAANVVGRKAKKESE